MIEIPASLVKQLRDRTNVGMMSCKKALQESHGDLEAAVDWLRTKGLASATSKFGRSATEGVIVLATHNTTGAIIELNTETDFAARNQKFQTLAHKIVHHLLSSQGQEIENFPDSFLKDENQTVLEMIHLLISTIGENIVLRRWRKLNVNQGVVAGYVHNVLASQMGRIGILVALESEADSDQLYDFGKQLAMHIAAAQPEAITQDQITHERLNRERTIFTEQALDTGKSEKIISQIVEGRLRKFYEDVVLLEQTYVIDGETKVKEILTAKQKELGASITIKEFIHFKLN